ncbi:UNVERIFIED_CONTAM: hypothetical protein HDU68_006090 [Siphonaria sp. JEL0065]|nr:hypothetical protein HDU68_006090 [Siphonaria sp. JEL0065]
MAANNSINMSLDDLVSTSHHSGAQADQLISQNRNNRKAGGAGAVGPDGLPRAPRAERDNRDRNAGNRGARRGAGAGGRSDRGAGPRAAPYAGSSAARQVSAVAAQLGQSTLNVSNLNHNITQQDFHELFSTIGPVKSAVLNFDQNGRSKGTGTVTYKQNQHTQDAIKEFNGRQFDGRPMRIELLVSASSLATLAARAAPAAGHQGQQRGAGGPRGNARGRGAQRGGRGGRGPKGPAKTPEELAAQLDAEMDKYMQSQDGSGDAIMSL